MESRIHCSRCQTIRLVSAEWVSGALTILSSAPLRDLPDVSLEIFGWETSSLRSRSSTEALGVRRVFVGVLKYSKTCLKGLRVEPGDEFVCTYNYHVGLSFQRRAQGKEASSKLGCEKVWLGF